jgi:hypothetical protein
MPCLRSEKQVRGGRFSRATARHRRIVFSITASVYASFGQLHAEIVVQISLSEKVCNEGARR